MASIMPVPEVPTVPAPQAQAPLPAVDPSMVQAAMHSVHAQMAALQYLQQYPVDAMALAAAASAVGAIGMGAVPAYPPPIAPYTPAVPTPAASSVVSVAVDGMKYQYQLTDDDLFKVFSRYGTVKKITVDKEGTSASIAFEQPAHAQAAMNDLDGKVLNGLEGKLRISWAPATESPPPAMVPTTTDVAYAASAAAAAASAVAGSCAAPMGGVGSTWYGATGATMATPYPAMPAQYPGWGGYAGDSHLAVWSTAAPAPAVSPLPTLPPPMSPPLTDLPSYTPSGVAADAVAEEATTQAGASSGCADAYGSGGMSPDGAGKQPPPHVKGVRKYTCRFLIGIESEGRDKNFGVVRRIIGSKGANMKKIFKQTDAKLRLRGKGSGYFEGASQRESSEPLQLCVSCTSSDGYKRAVSLAEDLLEGVYDEYRVFCREQGRPELELVPTPQVVSTRDKIDVATPARNAVARSGATSAGKEQAGLAEADEEEEDDEGAGGSEEAGGEDGAEERMQRNRLRGRRSRGGKLRGLGGSSSDSAKVERGDPPAKAPSVAEIEQCIDRRNEARRQCNFQEADSIREWLHERGVALMDEPGARGKGTEVTTWRYWRD